MYQQGYQSSFHNPSGTAGLASSQYTKYQPVGYVQSQYNQSLNPSGIGQQYGAGQQYSQFQNPQSYHMANYRGSQQGHDAYLRSDSTQPAQSQFGIGAAQYGVSSFGAAQQYSQYQSPQSYHTANYRGDQQGHDAYLRSDSTQPAQSQYGIGAAQYGAASFAGQAQFSQPYGISGQSYSQFQSPQSYHTAHYRGNQQGHDAYLRSDSSQPAQSQFGIGASGMGFSRF
ncbi:hypothetical protein SAMN04487970_100594 [Paenibacillus tianmuensis]|uniref:Uncharacterized protein n=1 Tax=Paenibacillus tianmuensis TaxID=624147 RepID=A0A1G4Q452_9BACL|nr:hypothetical protein [Paenibacillus tianmuensis]SCW39247.1 hypothetical protein SAMN04487970_100594 [Paenibacillus tianmuensis]